MLPWWGWVLLWTVLVLGGALLVAWRARGAWRSAKGLGTEVSRATELLDQVQAALERDAAPEPEATSTAATQDPHRMWEHHRRRLAEQRAARRVRRAARMPGWARVDS